MFRLRGVTHGIRSTTASAAVAGKTKAIAAPQIAAASLRLNGVRPLALTRRQFGSLAAAATTSTTSALRTSTASALIALNSPQPPHRSRPLTLMTATARRAMSSTAYKPAPSEAAVEDEFSDARRQHVDVTSVAVPAVERLKVVSTIPQSHVRNFSIIAHIDHGKSTLADRLLEMAGNISSAQRQNTAQFLDKLEVERTRGITVKSKTASMIVRDPRGGGAHYLLNLIDTPGHVDFSYEVSRALSACEGALLLVDSAQGIQAQTLANLYTARMQRTDAATLSAAEAAAAVATAGTTTTSGADARAQLTKELLPSPTPQASSAVAGPGAMAIVPVLTKIDLPHAQPDSVAEDMMLTLDVDLDAIVKCSSKTGFGMTRIFDQIIDRVPPPVGNPSNPFRGLIFDSWYDAHRGVICMIKLLDGSLSKGDRIAMYHTGGVYDVQEVGLLVPEQYAVPTLKTGQVGYIVGGIKAAKDVRLGDTVYALPPRAKTTPALEMEARNRTIPLPGFRPAKSMVFSGLFPAQSADFEELSAAVEKLTLNDASVSVAKESSVALGLGFRVGYLGLLHMHVFSSRLEQEFKTPVIITAPTVPYKAIMNDGKEVHIDSPATFPKSTDVKEYLEPVVKATLTCPEEFAHPLIALCRSHRGELLEHSQIGGVSLAAAATGNTDPSKGGSGSGGGSAALGSSTSSTRVLLRFKMPFAEIVTQFYDRVKSISSGYASFDYELTGYEPADLQKLDIKLNGESVDALSLICAKDSAADLGRTLVGKLKEEIDRANFEIIIQAAIGSKIVARERIAPYRKDVLTKGGKTVGGGDMTRKRKLLDKQKEGKKKMKMIGNVELSDEVFLAVLKTDDNKK